MYERDPITGKAIGGIVQLRNAKVAHWLGLAKEVRSPVLIVRYEHLAGFEEPDFATATKPLMKWLSKLRHRWPKLLVDAHRMKGLKGAVKQQIGDEGSWTARQGKSNIAMRQPVLTGSGARHAMPAQHARMGGGCAGDGKGAWCAIVFSRGTRDIAEGA
jgi:hypothetical protein